MVGEHLEPGCLLHVGQRVRVAGDRRAGLPVVSCRHLLAFGHRLGLSDANRVALNRVGAPDRPCDETPPQLPEPAPRFSDMVAQIHAEPFELAEHSLIGRVDLRNAKQHATMLRAS